MCIGRDKDGGDADRSIGYEESNMKFSNIENRLAAVAAVIVLLGVSFAAEDALASPSALDSAQAGHMSHLEAGRK